MTQTNSLRVSGLLLVLGMAAYILSCEHDVAGNSTKNTGTPTFTVVLQEVFEPSCGTCHLNGSNSGGLDLSAYANIVNVPSTEQAQFVRVKPNDPGQSYLYMKITGDSRISGSSMPLGGTLSQEKKDLVRSWIEAGAPNTE